MSISGASEQISQAALSWVGVTTQPHRFGGTEYLLGTRELGHLHGDYLLDIPFPSKVRNEIVAAKEAEPHHLLSDSGWVSFYIRAPADIERAIALLKRSYAIAYQQHQKRTILAT